MASETSRRVCFMLSVLVQISDRLLTPPDTATDFPCTPTVGTSCVDLPGGTAIHTSRITLCLGSDCSHSYFLFTSLLVIQLLLSAVTGQVCEVCLYVAFVVVFAAAAAAYFVVVVARLSGLHVSANRMSEFVNV